MEWLNRFVTVMNCLCGCPSGKGISEMSKELGIGKGTLHRMLQAMLACKLVSQTIDKKYRLGTLAMLWGGSYVDFQGIHGMLSEFCDYLGRETAMYSYLCRYGDKQIYCIYTFQPGTHQQFYVHVGQRLPIYCSASAKSILAYQNTDMLSDLMAVEKIEPYTQFTKKTHTEWLEELEAVRATGLAYCLQELEYGVAAMSSPIFSSDNTVEFSISVVGNADYIAEKKDAVAEKLLAVASAASVHLKAGQKLTSLK